MGFQPTISKHILKKIQDFDKRLIVKWDHDLNRWQIWYKGRKTGRDWHLTTLQYGDGSYMPVDQRILKCLTFWDRWNKFPNPADAYTRWAEEMDKQKREKRMKQLREDIIDFSIENKSRWRKQVDLWETNMSRSSHRLVYKEKI